MTNEDVMNAIIEAHRDNDTADVKHYALVQFNRIKQLEADIAEIDNLAKNCLIRDLNDGVAALNQIRNRIKQLEAENAKLHGWLKSLATKPHEMRPDVELAKLRKEGS